MAKSDLPKDIKEFMASHADLIKATKDHMDKAKALIKKHKKKGSHTRNWYDKG